MSKFMGFLAVAVLAVGCAASSEDGETGSTDQDVTASSVAWFDCHGGSADNNMTHLEVSYSKTKLTVTDLSKSAAPADDGKIDPSYHPTSAAYEGTTRYTGFAKIGRDGAEAESIAFLVSKEIQDGKSSGKLFMREQASDGGGTVVYSCKAKDGPLKVDTSTKARISCGLSLECKNENPPGQTCLDSAFIQQTATKSATMKVNYIDHFGVHVSDRSVDEGTVATFKRTATGITGEWNGAKVDLTYQGAGVTYNGTITFTDGRKATAKCNDLAMLDE